MAGCYEMRLISSSATKVSKGRFDPFATPSANVRCLRIAVVHCVVYAPWNSAPRPRESSFILTN